MARKSFNSEKLRSIKIADIDIALQMLQTYLDAQDIKPLLTALEILKTNPQSEAHQEQVMSAFDECRLQGAVLTYAPWLHIFASDDPFGD